VLEQAQGSGLSAVAITDHDTVEGVAPTLELAAEHGIEVIPGIELSSEAEKKDIHILGYFLDCQNAELLRQLKLFQEARVARIKKMIEKLAGLGIEGIDFQEVASLTRSNSVGRLHLATVLVRKGVVTDIKAAFDKYLGENGPAYVPKWKLSPTEAIRLIKQSGGSAVLAHPMVTAKDELIPSFVRAGLDGIEVFYPFSSQTALDFYKHIAQKHNLVMTGGSDSHGKSKPYNNVGSMKVPYEQVEALRARAGK